MFLVAEKMQRSLAEFLVLGVLGVSGTTPSGQLSSFCQFLG